MIPSLSSQSSGMMLLGQKVIVAAITLAMLTAAVAETNPESSTDQVAIAYEKPKNPAHDGLHDLLIETRVLEQVQEILESISPAEGAAD